MATVGTSWTTIKTKTLTFGGATVKFLIQAKYTTQSVNNNQTLGFQTKLRSEVSGAAPYGWGYEFTCTYCNKRSGSGKWTFETEDIITSTAQPIDHLEDGTRSLTLKARVVNDGWGIDETFSGTATLPKIDRYAYITVANDFNDTDSPIIRYKNPLSLTVKPYMQFYTTASTEPVYTLERENITPLPENENGFGYQWVFTQQEIDNMRSYCKILPPYTVKIGVYSYFNNEWKTTTPVSKIFTVVKTDATISETLTESDANVRSTYSDVSKLVNNVSKLQIQVNVTGSKNSNINKLEVITSKETLIQSEINTPTYSYTFNLNINDYIPDADNTFNIKVTDSRGYETIKPITKYVVGYKRVDNGSINFKRVNPTSSKFYINGTMSYKSMTFPDTTPAKTNTINARWGVYGEPPTQGHLHYLDLTPSSTVVYDTTNDTITFYNYEIDSADAGEYEIPYNKDGQFYFYSWDRLTTDLDTGYYVTSSVPTIDMGKDDLNINGKLYITSPNDIDRNYQVDLTPFRAGTQQEPSVYNFPTQICTGGFITSSRTNIFFTVYLPRLMPENVKPTVTGGNFKFRTTLGKYVDDISSGIDYDDSRYALTIEEYGDNQMTFKLYKSAGYDSTYVTNNTPIGVSIDNLQITFVETSQNQS